MPRMRLTGSTLLRIKGAECTPGGCKPGMNGKKGKLDQRINEKSTKLRATKVNTIWVLKVMPNPTMKHRRFWEKPEEITLDS